MKYFFTITFLILLNCNSSWKYEKSKEVAVDNDKCHIYPPVIDSLHVRDLYDTARWYIYTRYCDVLYKPINDSLLSKPFGELELKFDNIVIENDTAALFFSFIDNEQPILPSMMREFKQLATGVSFDIKKRKKIYIISSNTNITYKGDSTSRYEVPLQPEVIKYIKENWKKLDDCFKELAEQKGIVK